MTNLNTLVQRRPDLSVSDVTPTSMSSAVPKPKERRVGRIGLWALVVGFGGFLLWAGLAPLDEGVPGQGMVASTFREA